MRLRKALSVLLSLSLMATVLVVPSTKAEAAGLPSDAVYYEGHYYKVYDKTTTWEKANKECKKLGGHLVTITDASENDFVYSLIENAQCYDFWLGATDKNKEGVFEWVTGEEFKYTKWSTGEPSNSYGGEEDYVGMYRANGCWNDYTNQPEMSPYIGYICEWEYSVSTDFDEITLGINGTESINGKVKIANLIDNAKTVSYKSSNKNVVRVSSTGKIKGLKPGVAVVTAAFGDEETKITVNVVPDTVENVKVKKTGSKELTIKWAKQSDVSGYEVYMYDSNRRTYKCVVTNYSNTASATIKGLKAGTTYKFKVRSFVEKSRKKYYGDFSNVLKTSTAKN